MMAYSKEDKITLLKIARTVVEARARGVRVPDFDVKSPSLLEKRGAFVTIHKNSRLRGCIGVFASDKPLYETIVDMAVSASTEDPRFNPVEKEELPSLNIEISVLSPLKQITDVNEIEIGCHGIYIMKGRTTGVLLPQVATEHGFDRLQFLEETCIKAGLAPGSWKEGDCRIYVFTADIIQGD